MWPYLVGGVVLLGGGYYVYKSYQAAQAAQPINQIKSTVSSAVDTASTLVVGGDQSTAVKIGETVFPFVNPVGSYEVYKGYATDVKDKLESIF
jgi:hypothetical protein